MAQNVSKISKIAANASNLSAPRYGYDFVLSTTQDSINATMMKYLDKLKKNETYIIFVRNAQKQTVPISLEELLTKTKGVNPFTLPKDADPEGDEVQALLKARFMAGIKITLGLPTNFDDPTKLPPIVNLTQGASSVIYNMLCADINVCQLALTLDGAEWTTISQNDTPNQAWIFKSKVDLRLDTVGTEGFSQLPQNVKDGIKNMDGAMFGVQQLIFDLNNAGLQTVPTIEGLDSASDIGMFMTKYFVNTYFDLMHKQGQPVLNYTVIHKPQTATLKPTDLNFHVSPLVDQLDPGLRTLSYLCATENKRLPPAVDFTWDWLDSFDAKQFNGIISINRNTFANYLMNQIYPAAKKDCFVPFARAWMEGLNPWFNVYADGTPDDSQIKRDIPASGNTIIKISYSAEKRDYAGLDGAMGHAGLRQDYTKEVIVFDNRIIITTHMVVNLSIKVAQTKNAANVVDKTITDEYELAVDAHGQLLNKYTSTPKDESQDDSANFFVDFFTDVNDLFNKFKTRDFHTSNFKGTQIESLQNFMFPGGDTFAFKQFQFSDHQDLLAAITYIDPPAQ